MIRFSDGGLGAPADCHLLTAEEGRSEGNRRCGQGGKVEVGQRGGLESKERKENDIPWTVSTHQAL